MREIDRSSQRLDSDLLRIFLAVAEAGSVSAGATRLYRTQSAVSLQIQKLEDMLAQRLFERHGRGVTLTQAGEALLPVARQVVETLDRTASAIRGIVPGCELRLGIPDEYDDSILRTVLAEIVRSDADARIILHCASSTAFRQMIAEDKLDVALLWSDEVCGDDIMVQREYAVWAGSVYHDIESRRPLPVALYDKDCWWRDRSLERLDASGVDYEIICTSHTIAGVRAAIAAGIAVGVLPERSLTPDLRVLSENLVPHMGEACLAVIHGPSAPPRLTQVVTDVIRRALNDTKPSVRRSTELDATGIHLPR